MNTKQMFDRGEVVRIGKILDIIHEPDPRLHIVSEPISVVDDALRSIMDNMVATMLKSGVGLAAVQVGIMKRMFVMDCATLASMNKDGDNCLPNNTDILRIINPVIIRSSGECKEEEGCLSVPGVQREMTRPSEISVEYLDYNGLKCNLELTGWIAKCFQHEFDHLNGITLLSGLSPLKKKPSFKKVSKAIRK